MYREPEGSGTCSPEGIRTADLFLEGDEVGPCGWLKDKFGLSWQIIPRVLGEMMESSDTEKASRAMNAMLQMQKIDVAALKRAYEGAPTE